MNERFRVGIITSPHGIKGEVKVYPTTDDLKRFLDLKEAILVCGGAERNVRVEGVKFFKNLAILKLSGIESPEAAKNFQNADLFVTRENAVPLDEGEYYIADMIGADIFLEDKSHFGTVRDILQTAANDVIVAETDDGKEVLLPVTEECVLDMDAENARITIHLLKGLL